MKRSLLSLTLAGLLVLMINIFRLLGSVTLHCRPFAFRTSCLPLKIALDLCHGLQRLQDRPCSAEELLAALVALFDEEIVDLLE